MIAEAHARNLEFHAWMNPYRGGQPATVGGPGGDMNQLAPNHPLRAHPEWAVVYPVGTRAAGSTSTPASPRPDGSSRTRCSRRCRSTTSTACTSTTSSTRTRRRARTSTTRPASPRTAKACSQADWRRDNVNTLVREMNERIKAIKPWVKFGISPFGIWRNSSTDPTGSATNGLQSYDEIYADTREWVRQGWLDYIVPQLYWHIGFDRADYAKLLPWWSNVVNGTKVQLYIGQADYRVGEAGAWSDPAELERHLALNTPVPGQRQRPLQRQERARRRARRGHPLPRQVLRRSGAGADDGAAAGVAAVSSGDRGDPARARWGGHTDLAPRGRRGHHVRDLPGRCRSAEGSSCRHCPWQGSTAHTWTDRTPSTTDGSEYCVSGLDRSWNEGRVSSALRA